MKPKFQIWQKLAFGPRESIYVVKISDFKLSPQIFFASSPEPEKMVSGIN